MERYDWADPPALGRFRAAADNLQLVPRPAGVGPDWSPVVSPRLSGRPVKQVLFVDPSLELQRTVQSVRRSLATVHCCSTFEEARQRLISNPPDLLVTSVRLDAHNGLHLVYLAARCARTRSIVHLTSEDSALASEAEAAGAFVVREPWLVVSIESLLTATLPASDRRNPGTLDRRCSPRGGRRCTDSQAETARKPASVRIARTFARTWNRVAPDITRVG